MDDLQKVTYIGATDARGKRQPFGIKALDRAKHMYVIGKTGMGKSTLLENMAIQDIQHGNGLGFIDPHGSTAEKLLDYVPENRIKDVIYFAPFDMDYPIAFNVMEDVGYDKRHLVVSGLMSTFKKIWVDAWSARMEYILTNVLLALLEYPDSTLLDVNKMLTNKAFRKKVVENITDPIVKDFWTVEFAGYTDRYTQEATPAIQNKIGQFTSNPLIRNIVGQPKSSFDMREILDSKKIFIANLSKGRMGETNAALLGSMLTTKIYLSAMSRADEPASVQAKLPPFYFYVDEFQSIANESFADILSEARKYKLALTIAHQYVEQMEENVRNAVFGNVGSTIAFRVGPFDAEVLETIFQPKFMAEDLVGLGFAQIYLTLMIDGVGSAPFSATTLPPIEEPEITFKDEAIKTSRSAYGRSRAEVEQVISDRNKEELPEPPMGGMKKKGGQGTPQKNSTQPKGPIVHSTSGARKEKTTIPLAALKMHQKPNDKGPSPEQRSALKEALMSAQKKGITGAPSAPKEPKSQENHSQPQRRGAPEGAVLHTMERDSQQPEPASEKKEQRPTPPEIKRGQSSAPQKEEQKAVQHKETAAQKPPQGPPQKETPEEVSTQTLSPEQKIQAEGSPGEVPLDVLEDILKDDK
ncbi:MAG: type IV secretion system DNA-binding domain-containing protein [Candidatus Pacebacteria bacterium]|nr:type IV secretion system DNA-binding domain-containing protein [Candidatus Paceibacterota bacterium]